MSVLMQRRMNVLESTAKEISEKTGNPVVPIELNVRVSVWV